MDKDAIIESIIKLRDCWFETEKSTGNEIWGECATDLDNLIEEIAEQM